MNAVRSPVEKIRWPAPIGGNGAHALALQYQLAQSQWWSAEEIEAHQYRQLRQLLRHAYAHCDWYRAWLDDVGFQPKARLDAAAWQKLPLLPRVTVQERFEALHCDALPKSHGRCSVISTSGSTGTPVRVTKTGIAQLFWRAFSLRDHLWHRRDFGRKLAAIRRVDEGRAMAPQGVRQRGWGSISEAAYRTGPSVLLSVHSAIADQAAWLVRENPAYLLTYPTNAATLARHCINAGIKVPGLREVRTLGETVDPDCREAVREAWGVQVTDMYSTQEIGYLALQCPEHEHYHVQSEGVFLEVVADDGSPCGPGEVGRVVATPLHNFRMPLLRYIVGDYAEVGESCTCGRGLPVLKRILGRQRNMLCLPDGSLSWPAPGIKAFCDRFPIRQAQMVQVSLEEIELNLVVRQALTPEQEEEIRRMTVKQMGHPFNVRIAYHDEIPRSASGKFEEFKSLVT